MTAKQKAARAKFKMVVAEASKLRKKNPKLTQAQAVKQAWAIEYSKDKKGKKVVSVGKIKRKPIKKSAKKKSIPTKVKARRKKSTEMHTDTKSHNVNIRVVSGTKRTLTDIQRDIDDIKFLSKRIKEYQDAIDYISQIKPIERSVFQRTALNRAKYGIKNLKQALTKVKKNIKF